MPGRILLFLVSGVPPLCALPAAFTADVAGLVGVKERDPFLGPVSFGASWRTGVLIFGVGFTLWGIYRQHYRPFVNFRELRHTSFDEYFSQGLEKLKEFTSANLRLNVMRAHAVQIGHWFHAGRLKVVYHNGYDIAGREPYLRFHFIRIGTRVWAQGVCGHAIAEERIIAAAMDDLGHPRYHLTKRMTDTTRDVRMVISLPVPEWRSKAPASLKLVGLINVDCDDEDLAQVVKEGGKYWKELQERLKPYRSYAGRWL